MAAGYRELIYPNMAPTVDDLGLARMATGMMRRAPGPKIRLNGTPLDRLRFETEKKISERQYRAGTTYLTMIESLSATGSNAGGISKNGAMFVPATGIERERRAFNQQMRVGSECKPVNDPMPKLIDGVDRIKRVEAGLGKLEVVVLRGLLLDNRNRTQLAAIHDIPVKAMGWFLRKALDDLADRLDEVDRDFLDTTLDQANLENQR